MELVAHKVTFGPKPSLLGEIAAATPSAWIDQQLDHTSLDDSIVEGVLSGYNTLTNTNAQNWAVLQLEDGQTQVFGEVMHATFLRAVYSPKQIYEVMCDFWFNHLNVHMFGNYSFRHLTAQYLRDVIRPHALGKFTDMLQASAASPPMLAYLDNWRSNANSSAGVNENYGRELLELHTLGIRNGAQVYSEVDVRSAAYIMSGWSIDTSNDQDVFWFRDSRHWRPAVSLLGGAWSRPDRTGADDATLIGDAVSMINFLARHRSTAEYICSKLVRRFIADSPPESLVQQLADEWQATDTDITAVMRMLLNSPEFAASGGQKVRRGLETVALTSEPPKRSSTRTRSAKPQRRFTASAGTRAFWSDMGNACSQKATPDGYPDTGPEWVSSDGMLRRWETAGLLAHNALANGVTIDAPSLVPNPLPATMGELIDAMIYRLTASTPTAGERASYAAHLGVSEGDDAATNPFADPDVLSDFIGLCMSLPTFQYR